MRLSLATIIVLFLLVITAFPVLAQTRSQQTVCSVSANYYEAVNENNHTLLKLLSMINGPGSPLEDPGTAGIYYSLLISMRHYHQEAATDLPRCARQLNTVTIETIAATQDVVALLLAREANSGHQPRYEYRLEQARTHLSQKWQELISLTKETSLTLEER